MKNKFEAIKFLVINGFMILLCELVTIVGIFWLVEQGCIIGAVILGIICGSLIVYMALEVDAEWRTYYYKK